jgi:phosphoglycolate phosphatase-like HAD superfamily hydrolase
MDFSENLVTASGDLIAPYLGDGFFKSLVIDGVVAGVGGVVVFLPQIIIMILKKYNITKENCLFITDTLGDLLEARKIGIRAIAFASGFHEKERLEKGNPINIVSSFEKLFPLVNNIFNKK